MQSTCVQNLTILAFAVPQIPLGAPKFKVGHMTLTTRLTKPTCVQNVTTLCSAVPKICLVPTMPTKI